MTPPSADDRAGSSGRGTGPLPPLRAADTGPVPIVGSRPAPPSSAPQPVVEVPGDALTDAPSGELPVTEQPTGRAGRNLPAAIGVGVGLVAVIVASLVIWRPAFLVVLVTAILVAVVELTGALKAGRFRPPLVPLLLGTLVMEGLAWTRGPTGLVVGFLITALAVVLWRLADGPEGYLHDAASGVLVALYVPLLAGFAVLLLVPEDGATRVLAFIATVVASDVGGYAAGVLFGKHPMAPSISPKKSWEGMAGSVLACMLVATPFLWWGLGGPWWSGLVFGAALAGTATIGDLGESLIKRDLGIKDMGNLLPGHGGIMDRLDSLLPSAAVAYLLLSVLAPA
ncbi:phosphatidate cytidylyltransferase [Blastococcus sp. PRF04-17]|uniref:phosphatidate cytidylyltransferase n=1 Tax=Blastococcus sp. PRF04-17 TaxID=2933797 RepID=UPI001FF3DA2D|nr:phosphatidate cytidylyltransferase [Blastococcus sp. PRF04-17]UOY01549.1 phosphatidate cytidylyltransferase [Blastococcus sp. PRF04-17]